MTEREKIEIIAECVDMESEELTPDTVLDELDNWDSVAVLSIIAIMNEKFDKQPSAAEIMTYKTVKELMGILE